MTGGSELAKQIIAAVRGDLKPSEDEYDQLYRRFLYVKEKLMRCLSDLGKDFVISLQGSLAKDTVLRGASDIDVFVLFNPSEVDASWFEEVFIPRVMKCFEEHERFLEYATHPYLTLLVEGVEVNVVPAFMTRGDKPLTAVDRTPYHTRYVVKKLSKELRDEVRLLKRFLKTLGIYGAEVGVKGFSGYVAELLIAYYGSFLKVLKAVLRWREGSTCIDIERHYSSVEDCVSRFRDAVIVVVDPVDPRRNAAAAVSKRALDVFRVGSALFQKCPSRRFFQSYEPEHSVARVREAVDRVMKAELLPVLAMYSGSAVPDVLWGEIRRVERSVVNTLRQRRIEVVTHDSWVSENRAILVLLIHDSWRHFVEHEGPPATACERVVSFIVKNSGAIVGPWIEEGALRCIKARRKALREEIVDVLKQFSKVKHLELQRLCIGADVHDCIESLSDEDRALFLEAVTRKRFVWLAETCIESRQS